jgi:hypothetical protein
MIEADAPTDEISLSVEPDPLRALLWAVIVVDVIILYN